ncbi:MAG: 50S ribosomal protein L10 [Planctomycetota bacterium]
MSKLVKEIITQEIADKLKGVEDAAVVSYVGMDVNTTNELRGALAEKDVNLLVVKNSLARRATVDSNVHAAFVGRTGQIAVCWGAMEFPTLAKIIVDLHKDDAKFEKFVAEGGAMDGQSLDQDGLIAASKLPTREEQLSMLVGQILGPGASLSAALLGPGKKLASQVKQKSEE